MEIQGLSFGVNPVNKKENIFGDDIGFVELYDFSQANMSEKHRIHAISAVASICYQNPKAVGSESLYNRLLAESKGLPSSSFEFVPVLLTAKKLRKIGSIINKEDVGELCWNWDDLDYRIKEPKQKVTIEKWLCRDCHGNFIVIETTGIDEYYYKKVKLIKSYEVEL